ncbi:hypothetical protein GEMRC1_014030 [Eukaryota sp. GEM-RC1]
MSSFVILPPQAVSATVFVESDAVVSSLTLSPNVVLLLTNNSSLTVSDSLIINGGTLSSDNSSLLSFTSVDSLIVDTDFATVLSHKLIVTKIFDWKRGSIDLLGFSTLLLINSTFTSTKEDAVLLSSDVLHVWGGNSNGLLGGNIQESSTWHVSFNISDTISRVSLGFAHSLVLSTSGDVYTAGSNEFGQLGMIGEGRRFHDIINISNIVEIISSYDSSFALNASGFVFSWGGNSNGELGLGDFVQRFTPNLISDLANIKQIAGRYKSIFALTEDGKVFGWGSVAASVLCRSSVDDVPTPSVIDSLENINFISAGQLSLCGPLLGGHGSFTSPVSFAVDIKFTFIDTIHDHALGIDVNQKLWSWGWNTDGKLGTGDIKNSHAPIEVKHIGRVITAAAGFSHSVAVDVNNDVWSWGTNSMSSLGRHTSSHFPSERRFPDIIPDLIGKDVTGISTYQLANVAFVSVPMLNCSIGSTSNTGIIELEQLSEISGTFNNETEIKQFNLVFLPVFLSGTVTLTSEFFIFLSEFSLSGILSIDSPMETYFKSLRLGSTECSTLYLESNVFVETLYWYCGTIEGVGELNVNTLVFCSSNPELKLSTISIGKMMTSELSVSLNITNDLVLSINGIIEIPQLVFHSIFDSTLIVIGDFQLVNTSMSLHIDTQLNSVMEIDQNSEIQIFSSFCTIGFDFPLFLSYDWSESPSLDDLSGNDNTVLEVSGTKWNHDGYFVFEKSSDILKIPIIPGTFGWNSATLSLLIWFDDDSPNEFGFSSNLVDCGFGVGDHLTFGDNSTENVVIPRNQWITLVVTTDHNGAHIYVNGALIDSVKGKYDCDYVADFFPLGSIYYHSNNQWVRSSDQFFKGRIRKVAIFPQTLSESEVQALSHSELSIVGKVFGEGKVLIQDSFLIVNSLSSLSSDSLYCFNSSITITSAALFGVVNTVAKADSFVTIHGRFLSSDFFLPNLELDHSSFTSTTTELYFDTLSLSNSYLNITDSVNTISVNLLILSDDSHFSFDGYLQATIIHWFDGLLSFRESKVNVLNLYGNDKILQADSLTITEEVFYNNSLTITSENSLVSLRSVIIRCQASASLSLFCFNDCSSSKLELYNSVILSEQCSLISSFSIVNSAHFELLTLSFFQTQFSFSSYNLIEISQEAEFSVQTSTFSIDDMFPNFDSDPDLFLYYNWVRSPNTIDLSGNHDSNAMAISGPEWKFDDDGGYFHLSSTSSNAFHIPNIPGTFGWINSTLSLWISFQSGGVGFGFGNPLSCTFHIRSYLIFGPGSASKELDLPMNTWIHLVVTYNGKYTNVYSDGNLLTSYPSVQTYQCTSPPSSFYLSEIDRKTRSSTDFHGKIRAVKIYRKVLTVAEINSLHLSLFSIKGNGRLSFINSDVNFFDVDLGIKSISVISSNLVVDDVSFENLEDLLIYDESSVNFIHGTDVSSESLSITVNSSELFCDDSIDMSSLTVNLVLVDANFENRFAFTTFDVLTVRRSSFDSYLDVPIAVGHFSCFDCQMLGNQVISISSVLNVSSGKFSSYLAVEESANDSPYHWQSSIG